MTQARSRDDVIQQDIANLHKLGYAQELFRSMGGFSNFAISFSIISILTGAVILYNYGLVLGGPGANGIGWPLVTVFTLFIAAAMAEIASAYPTAGGLYYWASVLKNKEWGWWTAWLNFGGLVSATAGVIYSAAIYWAVTILKVDPFAETMGLFNAIWITGLILLVAVVLNAAGTRIMSFLNDLSVWWHIGFVAAIFFGLLFLGSQATQPLEFLFTVQSGSNADGVPWSSILPLGVFGAFMFGLLQAQWTYTGYDASAHVAEETVDAKVNSGWGVFLSVAVSAIVGFLLLAAVTLKMTSVDDVLANSPGGYGVAYVLFTNLGDTLTSLGGLLAAGIAIAMSLCGFSLVASSSRMVFAFSRDDGIPGSGALKKVNRSTRTPINAIVFVGAVSWLLLVVVYLLTKALNGDVFFIIGGVTGVSTVLLYWAYGLCIYMGMTGDQKWRSERAWSLGRFSRPIATVAILWVVVLTPLFLFPFALNPAAIWVVGGFLVLLAIYYLAWGRAHFAGPRAMGGDRELSDIEKEFEVDAGRLSGRTT